MQAGLFSTAAKGQVDLAHLLLEAGTSTNYQDEQGCTALMLASAGGHIDVVEILLKDGASKEIRNRYGQTALDLAKANGWEEIVELLASIRALDEPAGASDDYVMATVYYGTNRNYLGRPDAFGSERDSMTNLGTCSVRLPRDKRIGRLQTAFMAIKKYLFGQPTKIMTIDRMESGRFFQTLQEKVGSTDDRQAFVFIHGYSVSFEEACRQTAQLAYNLKFRGAPILYSWPSEGSALNYVRDRTSVEWSTPHFYRFLQAVLQQSQAQIVYLISHSMGARVLVRAVEAMAKESPPHNAHHLKYVILVAPDFDTDTFRELVSPLKSQSDRVTLYVSATDKALKLSKEINHGWPLGLAGESMFLAEDIDTIDASSADSSFWQHSYHESKSVSADIYELFSYNKLPPRFSLVEQRLRQSKYWRLE